MDTSEQYIKMIYDGWLDLEELWQPRWLDVVARYGTFEQVMADYSDKWDRLVIEDVDENGKIRIYRWRYVFQHKRELIPIFRQDQLQEMVGNYLDCVKMLNRYQFYNAVESMEQLWLAFVMLTLYHKKWYNGEWRREINGYKVET